MYSLLRSSIHLSGDFVFCTYFFFFVKCLLVRTKPQAAEFGIRVNSVNPGIITTSLWDGVPEATLREMCETTQLFGRPGKAEEVRLRLTRTEG